MGKALVIRALQRCFLRNVSPTTGLATRTNVTSMHQFHGVKNDCRTSESTRNGPLRQFKYRVSDEKQSITAFDRESIELKVLQM